MFQLVLTKETGHFDSSIPRAMMDTFDYPVIRINIGNLLLIKKLPICNRSIARTAISYRFRRNST